MTVRSLLLALLPVLAIFGCSRNNRTTGPLWDSLGPEADSLNTLLEEHRYNLTDEYLPAIDSLQRLADASADARMKVRADYWRALYYRKQSRQDLADKYALSAEQLAGTAPLSDYDRLRVDNSAAHMHIHHERQYYELFADLSQQAEQFGAFGDSLKVADCLNSMGAILAIVGSPNLAHGYFQQANGIYERNGAADGMYITRYNLANNLQVKGNTDSARNELLKLHRSPMAKASPAFHINVLSSLILTYNENQADSLSGYTVILDSLVNVMPPSALRSLGELSIADYLNLTGDYKRAVEMARSPAKFFRDNNMTSDYRSALKVLASGYLMSGSLDSARETLIKYVDVTDALDSINRHDDIIRMDNLMRIERMKTEMEWEHERHRSNLIMTVLLTLFCLAVALFFIMMLWNKRRLLRQRLYSRELENEQLMLKKQAYERRIVADSIDIENKNSILRSLSHERADIKLQLAGNESREAFKTTFENIRPEFFQKLKQMPSRLTEYDIRLCSYIVVGLDNKQIAQILNVQPQSVKKSRTRLRKKLSLLHEESLEHFLRDLAISSD